jgi:FAD:protein FMN transferase
MPAQTSNGSQPLPIRAATGRAILLSQLSACAVATSGTSVHRWQLADGRATHHLIDRRTGRSAATDVVQATVVAPTAREAEMLAKSAVILGARGAYPFLTRSSAFAAILLLECGDLVATPGTEKWLA